MKRIAIDGRMWGSRFTGIGAYLQEIVPRLFQLLKDHEFTVFTTAEIAEKLKDIPNVKPVISAETIYSIGEQTTFWHRLKKSRAHVTWFPHFNVPLLFHNPFVATIHDLTILDYPGNKMGRPWHRRAYKHVLLHTLRASSSLITVSNFTKSQIVQFDPVLPREKIMVIYNGVDQMRFQSIQEDQQQAWKKRFQAPIFLIAGVWRVHKNIPKAIAAFDLFRKHGGKGSLLITGRPDPYYPEVERCARQSRFRRDIHLVGFVDDKEMPALMCAADALVFPSVAEGFGLPALEAMVAGTPVIASKYASLPEICGGAAIYFDPLDAEDIALKMVDVLEDKMRTSLIQKGKQRADEFSWESAAEKTATALTNTFSA